MIKSPARGILADADVLGVGMARALALTPEAQMAREVERLDRLEASAEVRAETFERAAEATHSEAALAEAARERAEEGILRPLLMRPSAVLRRTR